MNTVEERIVALSVIVWCSITQTPTGQSKFVDDMPGNGRELFQANLDSLFYGKFRGLWTKE